MDKKNKPYFRIDIGNIDKEELALQSRKYGLNSKDYISWLESIINETINFSPPVRNALLLINYNLLFNFGHGKEILEKSISRLKELGFFDDTTNTITTKGLLACRWLEILASKEPKILSELDRYNGYRK